MCWAIVVELNLDLTYANSTIDGESLTPSRTRIFLRNDGLAQSHGAKAIGEEKKSWFESRAERVRVTVANVSSLITNSHRFVQPWIFLVGEGEKKRGDASSHLVFLRLTGGDGPRPVLPEHQRQPAFVDQPILGGYEKSGKQGEAKK